MPDPLPAWRETLRTCVFPAVSRPFFRHPRSALRSLRSRLAEDSPLLLAYAATQPFEHVQGGKALCCAACPLAYLVWWDRELDTVGQVHAAYAALLVRIASYAPWKTSVNDVLNWIETHRWETVRMGLIEEIGLALTEEGPCSF